MSNFKAPWLGPEIEKLINDNPHMLTRNQKFVAKLSFRERCAAFAAVKAGFSRKLIALAYGINIATLEHMLNPHSKHYKTVRKEFRDLGDQRFINEYLDLDARNKIAAYRDDPRLQSNQKQIAKEISAGRSKAAGADRRATHKAGTYTTFSNIDGTMHVEVAYVLDPGPDFIEQTPRPEGWYARLLSTSPDWKPLHKSDDNEHGLWYGTNGSWMTSKKALENFLAETMAEVIE